MNGALQKGGLKRPSDTIKSGEDPFIGKVLDDRYLITGIVGKGGMATVYKAQHSVIERQVAIKILSPKSSSMTNVTKRFYREARVVNRIQHPNVLDVMDLGQTEDGLLYLVMDLLTGDSVYDRLGKGNIDPRTTIQILEQVCRGLGRAHDLGIIHRDLSPSNIFLAEQGGSLKSVKVLDFGIAFIKDETRLSMPGTVLGTPHYMAPEYAMGKDVTPASDLYSLGCVAYEMLCGTPPFDADDYSSVIVMHVKDDPKPLIEREPTVPARLSAAIMRCLEKDPGNRYMNAYELHEVLEAIGRELDASRRSRPPKSSTANIRSEVPTSTPPSPVGYEVMKSYVDKVKSDKYKALDTQAADSVKGLFDRLEALDVAISESEGQLRDLEARVIDTTERFERAQATLEGEVARVKSSVAALEHEHAAASGRRQGEDLRMLEVRARIADMEKTLGVGSGSRATLPDGLISAYEEVARLVGRWREARAAEKAVEENCEERKGELKDLQFQLEQLKQNRDQNLARLEGQTAGLRMMLNEKQAERAKVYQGLMAQGGTEG
jgi:serine/threonine-protein kinase